MEIKDLIKENVAFHCDTEEKANELLKKAHDLGYKWNSGYSYLEKSNYDKCEEDTCYFIAEGSYGSYSYSKDEGYKIIEYILDMGCNFMKVALCVHANSKRVLMWQANDAVTDEDIGKYAVVSCRNNNFDRDLVKIIGVANVAKDTKVTKSVIQVLS